MMYEEYSLQELEKLRALMVKNGLDTEIIDKTIEKRKNRNRKIMMVQKVS